MILGLGILLAPLRKKDDLTPAVRVAERVRHLAAHISELDVLVAIGGATELENASHSYAEARRALRMARAMPDLRPIVTWDDLGVFRALSLVPPEEAENGAIDPRVRQLLADESLATTAETFLNLAGDVQRTAAELYVHRTTLYQRLDRIAALYKLDLRRNGDHRLIAHLGLKIARMAPL
jgi:sugar diacid utilization regulator